MAACFGFGFAFDWEARYGFTANNFLPRSELNHKFTLKGKLKLLFANEFFAPEREEDQEEEEEQVEVQWMVHSSVLPNYVHSLVGYYFIGGN